MRTLAHWGGRLVIDAPFLAYAGSTQKSLALPLNTVENRRSMPDIHKTPIIQAGIMTPHRAGPLDRGYTNFAQTAFSQRVSVDMTHIA